MFTVETIYASFLIQKIIYPGAYAPLTSEGNILVDGVLTSCYASFNHDLAHISMKPMQLFAEIQWIIGKEDAFLAFIKIAKELGRLILPQGHFLQY